VAGRIDVGGGKVLSRLRIGGGFIPEKGREPCKILFVTFISPPAAVEVVGVSASGGRKKKTPKPPVQFVVSTDERNFRRLSQIPFNAGDVVSGDPKVWRRRKKDLEGF